MLQSQNPKFRMDETAFGTEYNYSAAGFQTNPEYARGEQSAVFSNDTASFSAEQFPKSYQAGRGTAVLNGGG